ncbi:MAG: E3 binding domain-containing protein, partial [Wenzhouxiangellaceae bacterium]|nr:E3 binding domain-containing protein [Wenzhouxiangellaceae bacterium]
MATKTEIKVPDIGDFEKVPVIEVLVAEGDVIEEEQSLVTLESDKATMEVPASKGGKLVELRVSEGDEVSEGDVIGIVEVEDEADSGDDADDSDGKDRDREAKSEEEGRKSEDGSEASDEDESVGDTPETGNRKPETEKSEEDEKPGRSAEQSEAGKSDDLPAPPVPFAEMGRDPSSIPHASPAVRKLARELGVDLSQVEGSAEHGRITEEDLKKHVKSRMAGAASAAGGAGGMEVAAPPKVDFAKFGEIEEQKLSRIQKISGPALHRNWVTIPHVTQFDTADITEMEAP